MSERELLGYLPGVGGSKPFAPPVLNKDLWLLLDNLSTGHNIIWKWVKGHSGHRENEIADMLANKGIDEL